MQALNENWGACDIVMILHELHQRGYEQLRLHCGMSPNGMAWRWNIYPKCIMDDAEWERYGECPPFECPHGSAACPKCEVDYVTAADLLLNSDRDLLEKGKLPDKLYMRWFAQLVERAKRGEYPVAFGEYIPHYGYWRFMPSEDRLNLPPFRSAPEPDALRYDKRYQLIADQFARKHGDGEWVGAKYLGHYREQRCDAEGPDWLAFEPYRNGDDRYLTGINNYIFINNEELWFFRSLCVLPRRTICWAMEHDSYREPINLPPKSQPSRGKKDYVVAITAELV